MWLSSFPINPKSNLLKNPPQNQTKNSLCYIQMLSPFSCGFFHHPEDVHDEPGSISSPCSTPRRSTRRSSKDHSKNNPYSSRGLDKFSALLAELDEKRQKIYAQTPPQDISFVRFVYKDSDDTVPVPIVIKLKDNKREIINNTKNKVVVKEKNATHDSEALDKFTNEPSTPTNQVQSQQPNTENKKRVLLPSSSFNCIKLGMWRRPSYYLPVAMVFILVLLAVFGRSVAILCTSIGWYALPALKEGSKTSTRRSSKRKNLVRKLSDNNKMAADPPHGLSSPRSGNTTAAGTPHSHGHRKSW